MPEKLHFRRGEKRFIRVFVELALVFCVRFVPVFQFPDQKPSVGIFRKLKYWKHDVWNAKAWPRSDESTRWKLLTQSRRGTHTSIHWCDGCQGRWRNIFPFIWRHPSRNAFDLAAMGWIVDAMVWREMRVRRFLRNRRIDKNATFLEYLLIFYFNILLLCMPWKWCIRTDDGKYYYYILLYIYIVVYINFCFSHNAICGWWPCGRQWNASLFIRSACGSCFIVHCDDETSMGKLKF